MRLLITCSPIISVSAIWGGQPITGFVEYLYFSTGAYTSLGLGDVYPVGGLRLIAGIESLNGLVLIGWSASFTYLSMREFWPMHEARRRQHRDPRAK